MGSSPTTTASYGSVDPKHALRPPAVAALRQWTRSPALQPAGEVEHDGRLAGAAQAGIAAAQDRHGARNPGWAIRRAGRGGDDRAGRGEQARQPCRPSPRKPAASSLRQPEQRRGNPVRQCGPPVAHRGGAQPGTPRGVGSRTMGRPGRPARRASGPRLARRRSRSAGDEVGEVAVGGPAAIGQPKRAGSSGFWPPSAGPGCARRRGRRKAVQQPSSPSVSASQTPPAGGGAPRAASRDVAQRGRDLGPRLGMAGDEDGQQAGVRAGQPPMHVAHDRLLARMRAGGQPDGAAGQRCRSRASSAPSAGNGGAANLRFPGR